MRWKGYDVDVVIVEIGGTVGDIESLPFLEAIRQLRLGVRSRERPVHAPDPGSRILRAANEIKTKPTQHSVKELRSIGIQPDVLLCRCERMLSDEERKKIALFTNVSPEAVVSAVDVDNIYKIPLFYQRQGLDRTVLDRLGLKSNAADLSDWEDVVERAARPKYDVTVAMVGKYVEHADAYKSLNEALTSGGLPDRVHVTIKPVESEAIEQKGGEELVWRASTASSCRAASASAASRASSGHPLCAREHRVPFLGICLGMQLRRGRIRPQRVPD